MSFVVFINGVLMIVFGLMMALVALFFPATRADFTDAAMVSTVAGILLCLAVANRLTEFRRLHAFLLTASIWITGAAVGGLPLWFWQLSPADAFFEAMSGVTTTGSTVMTGLDSAPHGVLLWRAILQGVGGVGFIVAGIAFLPVLRVGGMQLFRTESSEADKEMTSAVRFAGATVWVYLGLIGLCFLTYLLGGMTTFEAAVHALTTLSTGGYSTSDASFGHFDSAFLQWAGVVFMTAGALPIVWYIRVLSRRGFDSEQVRALIGFFAVTIMFLTLWRVVAADEPFLKALREVAFNVVSVVTTTGYATTDYTAWGPFAVAVFFVLTAVGGCTGSTAGGVKMMRWVLFFRILKAQLTLVHAPHAVTAIRYEGRTAQDDVLFGVMTFFLFYIVTVAAVAFGMAMYQLDIATTLSAAMTAVANVGPGIGPVIGPAGNFSSLPDGAKTLLALGMYAGRLEVMTVFVLFTPVFWRDVA